MEINLKCRGGGGLKQCQLGDELFARLGSAIVTKEILQFCSFPLQIQFKQKMQIQTLEEIHRNLQILSYDDKVIIMNVKKKERKQNRHINDLEGYV